MQFKDNSYESVHYPVKSFIFMYSLKNCLSKNGLKILFLKSFLNDGAQKISHKPVYYIIYEKMCVESYFVRIV